MFFCAGSLFCGMVLGVGFYFRTYLAEEERAGCFTLCCAVAVSFSDGAVGWSAVCDCGISWPNPLAWIFHN